MLNKKNNKVINSSNSDKVRLSYLQRKCLMDEALIVTIIIVAFAVIASKESVGFIELLWLGILSFVTIIILQRFVLEGGVVEGFRFSCFRYGGDMDEVILKCMSEGLYPAGEYKDRYIFKSRNILLPNTQLIAKDCGDHCYIIGQSRILKVFESKENHNFQH